jgi:hypothetical protein
VIYQTDTAGRDVIGGWSARYTLKVAAILGMFLATFAIGQMIGFALASENFRKDGFRRLLSHPRFGASTPWLTDYSRHIKASGAVWPALARAPVEPVAAQKNNSLISSASSLPCLPTPAAEYQPPSSAPVAPGDSFDHVFPCSTISSAAPVIANWNASTNPGESLVLTGSNFTLQNGSTAGTDTAVWIFDGDAVWQAEIPRVTSSIMTVTLPSTLKYHMYLLWVQNSAGISIPVPINRADPQWIGPLGNVAAPGATKRVFGKDLSTAHGTTTSYVYLQPSGGGSFVAAPVTSVEPYAVAFAVPSNLAYGTYNLYVHNGHGGGYGWSTPLTLTVAAPWMRGTSAVTVPASGGADDSSAIQAAINREAVMANGGVVDLNEGTYRIQNRLTLPNNVELRGAGKNATMIEVHLTQVVKNAIEVDGNHVKLRGITFELVNDGTDMSPTGGLLGTDSFPVAYQDIEWDDIRASYGPGASRWAPFQTGAIAVRFQVSNSEFFLEFGPNQSDAWVHGNTFHGGAYQGNGAGSEAAVELQAIQRVVLEDNEFVAPVWPPSVGQNIVRRMLAATAAVASVQDLYVAHNTGTNVAPGPNENKGEIMLFHGSPANWYGQVISNSGATMTVRTDGQINGQKLTFNNYNANSYSGVIADPLYTNNSGGQPIVIPAGGATFGQVGMFASIVGGTGIGQIRPVAADTFNTITVVSPWRVPPDCTSKIVLGYVYKDVVIYDNNIIAFPPGIQTNSGASQLIDFDGNVWFSIADSNTVHHSFNAASIGSSSQNQSEWNVIENNTFLDLQVGGMSLIYWNNYTSGATVPLLGPVTLGNVLRHNNVQITGPIGSVVPGTQDTTYELGSIGGIWTVGHVAAPFPYHESNIF